MALNQSALAEDGSAAKIQAAGSNKAKLRDGTASFVDVSIAADAPGQYQLRVVSASRKHSVEDATTMIQLASSNTVTSVTLMPEVPAAGEHLICLLFLLCFWSISGCACTSAAKNDELQWCMMHS